MSNAATLQLGRLQRSLHDVTLGTSCGNAEAYRELSLKEPWMVEMVFQRGDLGVCAAECDICWKPVGLDLEKIRKTMATS